MTTPESQINQPTPPSSPRYIHEALLAEYNTFAKTDITYEELHTFAYQPLNSLPKERSELIRKNIDRYYMFCHKQLEEISTDIYIFMSGLYQDTSLVTANDAHEKLISKLQNSSNSPAYLVQLAESFKNMEQESGSFEESSAERYLDAIANHFEKYLSAKPLTTPLLEQATDQANKLTEIQSSIATQTSTIN